MRERGIGLSGAFFVVVFSPLLFFILFFPQHCFSIHRLLSFAVVISFDVFLWQLALRSLAKIIGIEVVERRYLEALSARKALTEWYGEEHHLHFLDRLKFVRVGPHCLTD